MVLGLKPRQSDSRVSTLGWWRCLQMETQVSFWTFLIKFSQSGFTHWLIAICAPPPSSMPILKWKCKTTIQIKWLWRCNIKLSLPVEPGKKCKLSLQGDKPKYISSNDWTSVSVMISRQLIPTLLGSINRWKVNSCKISISLFIPLASIIFFFPFILVFKLNYLLM